MVASFALLSRRQPTLRRRKRRRKQRIFIPSVALVATCAVMLVGGFMMTSLLSVLFKQESQENGVEVEQRTDSRERKLHDRLDPQPQQRVVPSLPILVVGGTDGSGTRAVVQALTALGVPMVVDDIVTKDVHAATIGGWPSLVSDVLVASGEKKPSIITNSANNVFYQDLKLSVRNRLEKLRDEFERRAHPFLQSARYFHKPLPAAIAYGFKAPSTMLLIPWLENVWGPIRYLHVVRDGRDIALGNNQSPVEKFYELYYRNDPFATDDVRHKAMRLWNDWNLQILDASESTESNAVGNGATFILRIEDLMQDRAATMLRLANFVQAPLDHEEFCCLATQKLRNLGQSIAASTTHRSDAKHAEDENIVSRFGRWHKQLANESIDFSKTLHGYGQEALVRFGYDPPAPFSHDNSATTINSCQKITCLQNKKRLRSGMTF